MTYLFWYRYFSHISFPNALKQAIEEGSATTQSGNKVSAAKRYEKTLNQLDKWSSECKAFEGSNDEGSIDN